MNCEEFRELFRSSRVDELPSQQRNEIQIHLRMRCANCQKWLVENADLVPDGFLESQCYWSLEALRRMIARRERLHAAENKVLADESLSPRQKYDALCNVYLSIYLLHPGPAQLHSYVLGRMEEADADKTVELDMSKAVTKQFVGHRYVLSGLVNDPQNWFMSGIADEPIIVEGERS